MTRAAKPSAPRPLQHESLARALADRLAVVEQIQEGISAGSPLAVAAKTARVSEATARRYLEALEQGGVKALARGHGSGRPGLAECMGQEARSRIKELVLRCEGSTRLAYQRFATDPLCPEPIREHVFAGKEPTISMRRAAYVTDAVQKLHRGDRTLHLGGISSRRDMTEELPDGSRRDIIPGDWWEMDDMSLNQPFWYPLDEAEVQRRGPSDKLAWRHHCGIGRQSLWGVDKASGKILGFEMIGRRGDAYKAEDILRFCRRLFTDWGLPRRGLIFEGGIWRSRRIKGFQVTAELPPEDREAVALAGQGYDRPPMDEADRTAVVGGLAQLGIEVRWQRTPRGKSIIEGTFHHLQKIINAEIGDR